MKLHFPEPLAVEVIDCNSVAVFKSGYQKNLAVIDDHSLLVEGIIAVRIRRDESGAD